MVPVSNSNTAAIGDAVMLISGGCEMLVVDIHPERNGVTAGWRLNSGEVCESWFPTTRLRLVRRMRKTP
jgi:hypothetical protein